LTELLQVQVIGTREIGSAGKFNGERGIAELIKNVRNDILFRDTNTEHLTLSIDANDTACSLVICSDKDRFARDAVHVDANAGFEVVEMDEAVLCNKEDDAVAFRDLHCYREIIDCLRWKENIDGFLLEHWICRIMIDLNDMQLQISFVVII
jgi:hypothetical protein